MIFHRSCFSENPREIFRMYAAMNDRENSIKINETRALTLCEHFRRCLIEYFVRFPFFLSPEQCSLAASTTSARCSKRSGRLFSYTNTGYWSGTPHSYKALKSTQHTATHIPVEACELHIVANKSARWTRENVFCDSKIHPHLFH